MNQRDQLALTTAGIPERPTTDEAERKELLAYADALEKAVCSVANGTLKPSKLPIEPMVRLIAYARTGTVRNARLNCAE